MGGHSWGVHSLAITSDGWLISGSDDTTIKVWNQQYDLFKTLDETVGGHLGGVWSLAITSDGLLISGSEDNTIKVWTKQYELLITLNE